MILEKGIFYIHMKREGGAKIIEQHFQSEKCKK